MRRIMICLGASAALMLAGAGSAEAAPKNKPCVTVTEFGKIKLGMSKAKAAKIFGTNGKRVSLGPDGHGYTNEVRKYRACKAPGAEVEVTFASGGDLDGVEVGWANYKSWVWVVGWTQ
ncbi:hypothetical protein [Kineosporia babensis]|uniref:Uncharacterized protein n=1 Tax=Kineosporia babensis TaxID=499548 RepID=A0A9X1NPF2_9ACTN|nr:hypothetical protein [Kineosporia babensis]MCD5316866.1 hypothetical protein [Kineosporia babensis]